MKKRLLGLVLSLFVVALPAQSVYEFSWPREGAWVGAGTVGLSASFGLRPRTKAFTPEQIEALDAKRIPRYDRYSLRYYSPKARKASDVLLTGSFVVPALLLLDERSRPYAGGSVVLVGESLLLSTALTSLAKELVHRPRPYTHNPNVLPKDKLLRDARLSFFSGHTSTVAAMTFVTAKIWSDYHPNSRWQPVVWTAAAALPLTTGFLRMRAGKHYPSDVALGFVVGATTGLLIPLFHQRKD